MPKVVRLLVLLLALAALYREASGQENPMAAHQHMPKDGDIHDTFYAGWDRPDYGEGYGCCHKRDCYPTKFKMVVGKWYALKREWIDKASGTYRYMPEDRFSSWIHIPDEKFEHNMRPGTPVLNKPEEQQRMPRQSPDGRSHVCLYEPSSSTDGMLGGPEGSVLVPLYPLCAVLGAEG